MERPPQEGQPLQGESSGDEAPQGAETPSNKPELSPVAWWVKVMTLLPALLDAAAKLIGAIKSK